MERSNGSGWGRQYQLSALALHRLRLMEELDREYAGLVNEYSAYQPDQSV